VGVVAVTDHVFSDLDIERALLLAAGHELRFSGNSSTVDEVRRAVEGADAVLNCYAPMPAEVIDALEGCRIIARYGIGVDTIDVAAATERGILVTNVPDYCIDEVSDHALALILGLTRRILRLDRAVRSGGWNVGDASPMHRLRGQRLGLVGFGRIARALATKAEAVGFVVLATDPYVDDEAIAAAGVVPRQLDVLLSEADIVSIHAPLTAQSRHLIDAKAIARMRQGAFLVNTSRGALVDTDALRGALVDGRLGGVGLDVLESEPPDAGDPLLQHPDAIVTPHAAFASEQSVLELRRKATEQVVAALAGQRPIYALNTP
jgi:D-3-phosphoglycerate dehydrogenase / 2-oxoglutarate reductase